MLCKKEDCFNCPYEDCIGTTDAEYWKQRYEDIRARRISQGLCIICGKAPSRPGRMTCEECNRIECERSARKRRERKAAGVCVDCGKRPPKPGRVLCVSCAEKALTKQRAQRAKRRRKYDAEGND